MPSKAGGVRCTRRERNTTPGVSVGLLGQVVGVVGAGYLAANPFLSKQTAVELGVARSLGAPTRRTSSCHSSKNCCDGRAGRGLGAGEFLLQAVATLMSNI